MLLSVKAMTPQEFSAFSFYLLISNGFLDKFQQVNMNLCLSQIFLQLQRHYVVKQNNAQQLVAKAAHEIENLLANRSKALEVSIEYYDTLSTQYSKRVSLLRHFLDVTQGFS